MKLKEKLIWKRQEKQQRIEEREKLKKIMVKRRVTHG